MLISIELLKSLFNGIKWALLCDIRGSLLAYKRLFNKSKEMS